MTHHSTAHLPAFLPDRINGIVTYPLETETSFLDMAARFADDPGTVVLASGGDADCARFNILGIDPWLSLRASLTDAVIAHNGQTASVKTDPLALLQLLVRRFRVAGDRSSPVCAGLLGYLSYDLKDCIEELPRTSIDDLKLPHLVMAAPSIIVVEDRRSGRKMLHVTDVSGDAGERRSTFLERLAAALPSTGTVPSVNGSLQSSFTRDRYMQAIDMIHDYIIRGHVYQVNMSQRFETSFNGNPFTLFTGMFKRNPAPFFAYVNAGDHHIVSTSPERFIELRGNLVEARPIKGTRPRGKSPEEDRALREDLAGSRKDDAELSMIVDLLRNDIGKVCRAGSVAVTAHKRIEAYENVFHMVSIVEGVLDDDRDAVDLIRATFPGGSITGCPKIRSMEIIDELEPVRRHIYTGSIGYLSFHDTMDMSIAIRTAVIKGSRLVFSVGGGIVFDSLPADEYEETLHKGRTLSDAIAGCAQTATTSAPVAWCNGAFRPLNEVTVPVVNNGFLYGYGIFETIRVQNGIPCRLDAHLDRFNRSWRFCFSSEPPDVTWNAVIARVVEKSGLSKGAVAVKILAAAGAGGAEETESMTLLVTARRYIHRLTAAGRKGLHCVVYPQPRYNPLASHKTMNYMQCRMANDWAKKRGADEAILMNPGGTVCETATANLLCVINGKWYRPLSDHVLAGTMENAVIGLLAARGIEVLSRQLTIADLVTASRLFLTNALMGIVPVHRLDDVQLPECNDGMHEVLNAELFAEETLLFCEPVRQLRQRKPEKFSALAARQCRQ